MAHRLDIQDYKLSLIKAKEYADIAEAAASQAQEIATGVDQPNGLASLDSNGLLKQKPKLVVESVETLQTLSGKEGETVVLKSYYDKNNKGGGVFYYSKENPFGIGYNESVVFYANNDNTGSSGYWIRISSDSIIYPESFGVKSDTVLVTGVSIISGTNVLTSNNSVFSSSDKGKLIYIEGAGNSGKALFTTISEYISDTVVELTDNAFTTVSGVDSYFGSDDTDAWNRLTEFTKGFGGRILISGLSMVRGTIVFNGNIANRPTPEYPADHVDPGISVYKSVMFSLEGSYNSGFISKPEPNSYAVVIANQAHHTTINQIRIVSTERGLLGYDTKGIGSYKCQIVSDTVALEFKGYGQHSTEDCALITKNLSGKTVVIGDSSGDCLWLRNDFSGHYQLVVHQGGVNAGNHKFDHNVFNGGSNSNPDDDLASLVYATDISSSTSQLVFTNNQFYLGSSHQKGIYFHSPSSKGHYYFSVTNNHFWSPFPKTIKDSLHIEVGRGGIIDGNIFMRSNDLSLYVYSNGITLDRCNDCTVSNNQIHQLYGYGISVKSCNYCQIYDNKIRESVGTAVEINDSQRCLIYGNYVKQESSDSTKVGIIETGTSNNNTFINNYRLGSVVDVQNSSVVGSNTKISYTSDNGFYHKNTSGSFGLYKVIQAPSAGNNAVILDIPPGTGKMFEIFGMCTSIGGNPPFNAGCYKAIVTTYTNSDSSNRVNVHVLLDINATSGTNQGIEVIDSSGVLRIRNKTGMTSDQSWKIWVRVLE